jgi:hypothetical protein
MCALSLTVLAGHARAAVTNNNAAQDCITDSFIDRAKLSVSAGQAKNVSSAPLTIHCPVIKRTSAPNVTSNDGISGIDIPVSSSTGLTCKARTWRSEITILSNGQPSANLRNTANSTVVSSTKLRIPALPDKDYWHGDGGPGWLFADLECVLPSQASIKDFAVTEQGSVTNSAYRIYPAVACQSDAANQLKWHYSPEVGSARDQGGLIWGQSAQNLSPFAMKCQVPNNSMVTFSVGPAMNYFLGCNLNSSNFNDFTWDTYPSTEWPSQLVPVPGEQPMMTIPVNGTNRLICGVKEPAGDGKLISYRTRPNPSRSSWSATASRGTGLSSGIDNNGSTRFTTNGNAAVGDYYQVDQGSHNPLHSITIDSGSSTDDYARGFVIEISDTGANGSWTTVATATGTGPFTRIVFQETFARFIRVRLTSAFSKWWSIAEFNAYSISDSG